MHTLARLNRLVLGAVVVVALLLGMQPLDDPDLGTHLAAGLWILDTRSWPSYDPFGAQGNFWLCYSWLAETLMGVVYRIGGFSGLKLLSMGFFLLAAGCVVGLVQHVGTRSTTEHRQRIYFGEWLTIALALPLLLPLCRLRPQILSWVFFAVLVACADRDRLHAKYLVPLTVAWVNVHVYWLLVPMMIGVHRVVFARSRSLGDRARGAAASAGYLLLSFVNPYGWRIFAGTWEYLFAHQAADALISEFAPLTVLRYEYFALYVIIVILALVSIKVLWSSERLGHLAVFVIFAVASVNRIKYLPMFALAAVPLLRTVWGSLLAGFTRTADERPTRAPAWRLALATAVIGALGVVLVRLQPVLLGPHRELFEIATRLRESEALRNAAPVNVLTDYNYAGWLILALWLDRPPGAAESRFKVAIDGRTLVIGQQRIREYDTLRAMRPGWIEIFNAWRVDVVVLPSRAAMIEVLSAGRDELGTWAPLYRTPMWTVLARQPPRGTT